MQDPVVAEDGRSYEREAWQRYFSNRSVAARSPVTQQVIDPTSIRPNYSLRSVIEERRAAGCGPATAATAAPSALPWAPISMGAPVPPWQRPMAAPTPPTAANLPPVPACAVAKLVTTGRWIDLLAGTRASFDRENGHLGRALCYGVVLGTALGGIGAGFALGLCSPVAGVALGAAIVLVVAPLAGRQVQRHRHGLVAGRPRNQAKVRVLDEIERALAGLSGESAEERAVREESRRSREYIGGGTLKGAMDPRHLATAALAGLACVILLKSVLKSGSKDKFDGYCSSRHRGFSYPIFIDNSTHRCTRGFQNGSSASTGDANRALQFHRLLLRPDWEDKLLA